MRKLVQTLLLCCFWVSTLQAQIKTCDNGRYLINQEGKPFFWLGDTAWELFHRLSREEVLVYLDTRKQQAYNVIQAVALAEMGGLRTPNRYGDLPLVDEDPTKLAVTPGNNPAIAEEYDYWDHVDWVIDQAAARGLYIGMLPTWGDKVAHLWGEGPIVFNPRNAEIYAASLAKRWSNRWNVLWILGGDRPVRYTSEREGQKKEYDDFAVWDAMARGIEGVLGKDAFITYHPSGGPNSSSQHIHRQPWLDMNAFQSGHGERQTPAWDWVKRDLALQPQKPTLDMEPCYEDHPVNPWDGKWTRQERGYFRAYDVRARIYRGVFAGACGVTYGHHHIWPFTNPELYQPINPGDTLIRWQEALHAEAAGQMQYLKQLMLSRPYLNRIADQSLILSDPGKDYTDLVVATGDETASYAMVYLPQNKAVKVDLNKISGNRKNIWWFNPRTGKTLKGKSVKNGHSGEFNPPAEGQDWVLVIDDASRKWGAPGGVK